MMQMINNRQQLACLRQTPRFGTGLLLLLSAILALPACGKRNYNNENDKLRANQIELQDTIKTLQQQLTRREDELQATRHQLHTNAEPIDGLEPPRLAGIVLGMYSGPIDVDGDLKYDAVRAYLRPIDQHGRQMTAIGPARLRLITVPDQGTPKALIDLHFTAEEFHKAYRSGITGTHYTLKAELPQKRPAQAQLHVTLIDAATGRTHTAQKLVSLLWDASVSE